MYKTMYLYKRLDKELVNILHIGYFLNRYGNILTELEIIVYSLIACEKTKVLSFDLHTETFQVICKSPFVHAHDDPYSISICILDNCLGLCETNWPTQDIWLLDSSGGNIKTWKKMCSIDLNKTLNWFGECTLLAIAFSEKNKLLLRGRGFYQPLVSGDT